MSKINIENDISGYKYMMDHLYIDKKGINKGTKTKFLTYENLMEAFPKKVKKKSDRNKYDVYEYIDGTGSGSSLINRFGGVVDYDDDVVSCRIDAEPDVRRGIKKNHSYLKCNQDSADELNLRGIFANFMLLPLVKNSPNISYIHWFDKSDDTISIGKDKTHFNLSELLQGNKILETEIRKLDIFDQNDSSDFIFKILAENAIIQCLSHLKVLHNHVELNMMGNSYFGDIRIKLYENYDTLEYKSINDEWEIPYMGIRVIFDKFHLTYVNLPVNYNSLLSENPLVGKRLSFTHYAGFFEHNISSRTKITGGVFSERLHFWDDQIESIKFLPAADTALIIHQAFYYTFGAYNDITRFYMSIEGTRHDLNNGNRKRLYTIEYNTNLLSLVLKVTHDKLTGGVSNVLKDADLVNFYFSSFLKKGEIVYTTADEIIEKFFDVMRKSGDTSVVLNNLDYYIAQDIVSNALSQDNTNLLNDLTNQTENYGRGSKSVYIPEQLLNIKDIKKLSQDLSRGYFNLNKITNVGHLSKLKNNECKLCLKNIVPKVCNSDRVTEQECNRCTNEDEEVCKKNGEECKKNSNVGNLDKGDDYWIAGGKQGQVFKGFLCKNCENPKSEDLTAVAVKKFPVGSTETICDSREGNLLTCSEFLNEVTTSLVTSNHYNNGKSPHYMKVYSVFKCIDTDRSAIGKTKNIIGYDNKYTNYFMVMERIHGTLNNIEYLVSLLESKRSELNLPILGIDAYIHNCVAQVLCILRTFHEQLEGMHLDFHPGNVFLKLCDHTLYNDKKICETKYFNFEFSDGTAYSIPNIGIIAKLGDLGHARIKPLKKEDKLIMRQPGVSLGEEFTKKMGKTLTALNIPGGKFLEQSYSSSYMRYHDRFDETYDLACLFNRMATISVLFNHIAVVKYHKLEKLFHMNYYGHLKHYYYNELNTVSFFLADLPTAYVPKITATFVTPKMLLETDIFEVFNKKTRNDIEQGEFSGEKVEPITVNLRRTGEEEYTKIWERENDMEQKLEDEARKIPKKKNLKKRENRKLETVKKEKTVKKEENEEGWTTNSRSRQRSKRK
jgi:hypothetical protein